MKSDDYHAISEASNKEALRGALTSIAEKMGFELVNALLVDGTLDSPTLKISSVGNTPSEFLQAHHDIAAIRVDPVLRRLIGPTTPFAYDQATYVDAGVGHLWEEQAPHGYRVGLAASLSLGPGRHVLVGVDRVERLPTNDEILTRMLADLQLLATHAHIAAIKTLNVPPPLPSSLDLPRLTQRERQVLNWAAQGKSAPVTAQILEISTNTVKGHIQSAMEKLGVPTKLQAVTMAKALGLL